MLWIAPEWIERLGSPAPSYGGLTDPNAGFDDELVDNARRHDTPLRDLAAGRGRGRGVRRPGRGGVRRAAGARDRRRGVAGGGRCAAAGFDVVRAATSTLVSWRVASDDEAIATRDRLQESGITIRDLPGAARLRASFGGWNDADDAERLLTALGAA